MTGDEIMQGNIIDSNGSFLCDFFAQLGLNVLEKTTVGDNALLLHKQINRLTQEYNVLLINGGLGPTEDDLTASVLALANQEALQRHIGAEQHVIQWCQSRNLTVNDANIKQADLPASATIFPNAPGSACAFYITINDCLVIATPGVPSELKQIMKTEVAVFLQHRFQLASHNHWQRHQLFGIGESSLQELINTQFNSIHNDYHIGFRANFPYLELKLQAKNSNSDAANHLLSALKEKRMGLNHFTVASSLVALLSEKQQTISTAESCTGGLIASEITKIPGSSQVFPGSIISYSNTAKHELLQVSKENLQLYGAVSEQVVKEMLLASLKNFHSDYAVAVSGIAGPEGGSDEKPQGTVYIAYGSNNCFELIKLCIPLPREQFQQLVCTISLDLLRRQILGYSKQPRYLSRWQAD